MNARAHWKELYLISIQDIITNVVFDPAIKYILWIDNSNEPCSFSYYLFQIEELWREGSRDKDGLLQPQSCTDQPWELYLQSPEWRHQRPRDYQVKHFQRLSGQKYLEAISSKIFRDYQVKHVHDLGKFLCSIELKVSNSNAFQIRVVKW